MKKKLLTIAMTAAMTVACAITSFAATQVYFEDFEKGANGDYTVVGSGKFDTDTEADFGTVYHNGISAEGTTRNNYLLLPSDIFTKVRATEGVDGVTVSFWAKTADDSTDWYFTPHFAAYGKEPSAVPDNTFPMFIIQKRQIAQVNCAGYSDLTPAQNTMAGKNDKDEAINNESTAYSDDGEWHLITVTMTATNVVYYVDGVAVNNWTLKNEGNNEIVAGVWKAADDPDALDYICLGGNQAWNWADGDVAMLYDDVAVYAGALTQDEVKAIIADKYSMTGIELSVESKNMVKGDKYTVSYAVLPSITSDVPTVTWTSSNEEVATVKDGVITAIAGGEATITATAKLGDKTFEAKTVTVKVVDTAVKIEKVEVKANPTTILKDTVTNIQVIITPADTTDDTATTYTSSDEKIAKVDSKGVVTGIAAGKATITVKVGEQAAQTIEITVINPSPEASKNPSADASKTEDDATGVITAEELKKLTIKLEGMDDKLIVSPVAADSADYKVAAAAKELKDLKWVAIDLKLESGKQPANGTKITLSLMDAIKDAKYVKVFRVDGTKLVLVDHVEVKDGKFTFAPDHFSTYIFAATTEAPTANPNTGDSTSVALALAMASIAAVALVAVRAKRRENA